jgi:hypothetical protein
MKRAILLVGLFLSATSWAEDVYWSNGQVWRGVTIGDITWSSAGMVVKVESAPTWAKAGTYGGAMKIVRPRAVAAMPASDVAALRQKLLAPAPRRTPQPIEKAAKASPKIEAELQVTPGNKQNREFKLVGTITNTTEQRIYDMEVEFTVYQGNRVIAYATYSAFALVAGKTESFRIPIGFLDPHRTGRDVPTEVRSKITSITFR